MNKTIKKTIPLGKQVGHSETYDPSHIFCVPRKEAREGLGLQASLPFSGIDIWNAYELSWLSLNGTPCVAMGEIIFPCESENIIESKSLKLYLNSFNLTRFESSEKVKETIRADLSRKACMDVAVKIFMADEFASGEICRPHGVCLDDLDVEIDTYKYSPTYLTSGASMVEEELFSNLLRTNCPVTGQPDWGTVMINYKGIEIDHRGLLRYLISFRQHTGFHENCVEQIFMDILGRCSPQYLSVNARFTRRGGLDINPGRSSHGIVFPNDRLARQ